MRGRAMRAALGLVAYAFGYLALILAMVRWGL